MFWEPKKTLGIITTNDKRESYTDFREYFFYIRKEILKYFDGEIGRLIVNLDNQLSIATFIAGISIKNEFGNRAVVLEVILPNRNMTSLFDIQELDKVYDLLESADSRRIADRGDFSEQSLTKAHERLTEESDEIWLVTGESEPIEFARGKKVVSMSNKPHMKKSHITFEDEGVVDFAEIMGV